MTPDAPDLWGIVQSRRFKKLANALATKYLGGSEPWRRLDWMNRDDLIQEMMIETWKALPRFEGRTYSLGTRIVRKRPGDYRGKKVRVTARTEVHTFLYRVLDRRMLDLVAAARRRPEVELGEYVGAGELEVELPLASSPLMVALGEIQNGDLLLAQALGYSDEDLGLGAADRKRRQRARAQLAERLASI